MHTANTAHICKPVTRLHLNVAAAAKTAVSNGPLKLCRYLCPFKIGNCDGLHCVTKRCKRYPEHSISLTCSFSRFPARFESQLHFCWHRCTCNGWRQGVVSSVDCVEFYGLCGILWTVWNFVNCVAFCGLCGLHTVEHTVWNPPSSVECCGLCELCGLHTVWSFVNYVDGVDSTLWSTLCGASFQLNYGDVACVCNCTWSMCILFRPGLHVCNMKIRTSRLTCDIKGCPVRVSNGGLSFSQVQGRQTDRTAHLTWQLIYCHQSVSFYETCWW